MGRTKGSKDCSGDRPVTCPSCGADRMVTHVQDWRIRTGKSTGDCKSCSLRKKTYVGRKNPSAVKITTQLGRDLYKTKIYGVWASMRGRCLSPSSTSYHYYGGRGITICERWNSFDNFAADMAASYVEGLTIERVNNEAGYGPDNCRWATMREQSVNTRRNRFLVYQGRRQTVSQWAAELGISRHTIEARMKKGWPVEHVLALPPPRPRR